MDLSKFNYSLPENLIAQHPLHRRDKARLMVIDRKNGLITHDVFADVGKYIPKNSVIVLNDSKVIPARLLGKRVTGAEVEIFLLKNLADGYCYETLMRPLKRLKVGEKIAFGKNGLVAEIKDKEKRIVRFNKKNIISLLEKEGRIPLPPYIKRKDKAEDKKYYQTVYADKPGSVAAPTAGLHFTNPLLKRLEKAGNKIEKVTLHVNYATFKPVEEKDITKHKMHEEEYSVTKKTLANVKNANKQGERIVAVGTTSCRVLEAISCNVGAQRAVPLHGITDMFIYPGYKFKLVDILITNFHLPFSTLLMLVYAFGGETLMKKAYKEAIKQKYRFYSYGDGMIIL